MLFLASFLLASAFAYAEEKFTVSGEVTIQYDYDGDIYMSAYYGRITSFTYPRA